MYADSSILKRPITPSCPCVFFILMAAHIITALFLPFKPIQSFSQSSWLCLLPAAQQFCSLNLKV
jgi:hypothetical protein